MSSSRLEGARLLCYGSVFSVRLRIVLEMSLLAIMFFRLVGFCSIVRLQLD
jgi:hypothetical protein